jgi:ubiquinol-cytochrome c reductase cytochrome b subunit
MKRFFDWLESRTGWVSFWREMFFTGIPGGPRWRYVWGRVLLFALLAEMITGVALWMVYSPSAQTAWESVHFIQYQIPAGWFLRGVHHYIAQILIVLFLLHLAQMVVDGAYRPPREMSFWLFLVLMAVSMACAFTGYVLPWDQRGYMASQISSGLMANTPIIGPWLRSLALGGSSAGNQTLTRMMAWHAGILPLAIIALMALRAFLHRRQGWPAPPKNEPHESVVPWWPRQALRDGAACLAVFSIVAFIVLRAHGAALDAPARPGEPDLAARPDWYFLFLFKMLHWEIFGGARQVIPSLILPGVAFGFMAALPWLSRWQLARRASVIFFLGGVLGYAGLTASAWWADKNDRQHQAALRLAERTAARAHELVTERGGVPAEGAIALLQNDPQTQAPALFAKKCASCHSYDGHNGQGLALTSAPSAADLRGFGSREWLRGLLDPVQLMTPRYWGGTAFVHPKEGQKLSKMVKYVTEDLSDLSAEKKSQLEALIAALSAEAELPVQKEADVRDQALIATGRSYLGEDHFACTDCHKYRETTEGNSPDLDGWASRQWTIDFILNPAHERFYGRRNDRMPAYEKGELTRQQIEWIVDWLREEKR